jgi:Asp-tRNA(Asn)/Glu-tRNA(Gln) amidotransferase A subunit family amidase
VAASFAVVGVGTDTMGSVRMPAAFNALVGLRPTVGLVSRTGIVPLNSVRDTAGPMARSVTDAAILLDVLVGKDPQDAVTERAPYIAATYTSTLRKDALRGARLGVLRQIFTPELTDPRVIAHFQTTLAELKAAGAEIVDPFIVPDLDSLPRPIANPAARFKDDLTRWIAKHPGVPYPSVEAIAESRLLHPLHQALFEATAAARPVDQDPATIEAAQNEQRYRDAFTKVMDAERIDAIVFPSSAQLPPIIGDRNTQLVAEPKPGLAAGPTALNGGLAIVGVGSALQWPALSVPSGFLGEGLPQGLQMLGRAWEERKIIGYAFAYEQATNHRRPPATVPKIK